MSEDNSASALAQKLKRLLSQDFGSMGYEAKMRHRQHVAEATRALERAQAQGDAYSEPADASEPVSSRS